MLKNKRVTLLFSIVLISFGVLFFSLAITKYQVITESKASSENVTIEMNPSETFGTSEQFFGLIIKDISNTVTVNELSSAYKNKNFQIQLIDPTPEVIESANFERLNGEGFVWYLSFSDYGKMGSALHAYYKKFDKAITAELRNNSSFNKTTTESILNQYPKVRFHTSHFALWPRETVRDVVSQLPPPQLDAVSIYTFVDTQGENVFDDIKTLFATFYDASKDISGTSETKINWPENSKLSLSDVQTLNTSVKEQARRFGIISSAFVVYVQTKNQSKEASLKYVTAGTFEDLAADEKKVLSFFSNYIYLKYDMVWPWANTANGDPWYNSFLANSNTDPIMGIIGIKEGKYLGIMFNSRDMTSNAKLPSSIDFAAYKTFSNIKGDGDYINGSNEITFEPYETVVFYTTDVTAPTITPATPQPTTQTTPTVIPYTPTGGATTTPSPTGTVISPTVIPTHTLTPTQIPTVILTETPVPTKIPTLTEIPTPTNTPIPPSPTMTQSPPTPTPIQQLTVDNQPPGITPWSLILVPIGILLLGLLL